MIPKRPRTAIVGATGAVGTELLKLMEERDYQFASLDLVASARSAGSTITFRGSDYTVADLEKFDFSQVDLAFFSAGTSTSKVWAPKAAAAGALVIDNTNAFRMAVESPLTVPQVNGAELKDRPDNGIIANPNCSTIQLVRALKPVHRAAGLARVVVSTYQAASGGGLTGMEELRQDARGFLNNKPDMESQRFPHPLAFNAVPHIDVFLDDGFTLEERKMLQETRKILRLPALPVTSTSVRVPVMNGHSEAVYVETERDVDRDRVLAALAEAPELDVQAELAATNYPTPRFLPNRNRVYVGRVRVDPTNPRGLWMWVVADNLRIGAALNAIQIAEYIRENL